MEVILPRKALVQERVPQGSVLGSLLFVVIIIDITDNIKSDIKLSDDDTMIYTVVEYHNEQPKC